MLRKFSVVNAYAFVCTEVLSQQAKGRNKRKKCSVISAHHAQTDIEMLQKQGKAVLCDMVARDASCSRKPLCALHHAASCSCTQTQSFCCENQRSLHAL
jgi:hypothetical protein